MTRRIDTPPRSRILGASRSTPNDTGPTCADHPPFRKAVDGGIRLFGGPLLRVMVSRGDRHWRQVRSRRSAPHRPDGRAGRRRATVEPTLRDLLLPAHAIWLRRVGAASLGRLCGAILWNRPMRALPVLAMPLAQTHRQYLPWLP
jgi:hypothetical protein